MYFIKVGHLREVHGKNRHAHEPCDHPTQKWGIESSCVENNKYQSDALVKPKQCQAPRIKHDNSYLMRYMIVNQCLFEELNCPKYAGNADTSNKL